MEEKVFDPSEPVFTRKVAAHLSDTSVYNIRKYVDKGLLLPLKTKSGRFLYSQIDIIRLRNIRKDLEEKGFNIAGIKGILAQTPCWLIKPCTEDDRKGCEAYTSSVEPCWKVTIQGPKCKETECRRCKVYRLVEKCSDVKTLFKEYSNYGIALNPDLQTM
jgi:MerR family transcriptional regulator/heat shock protein HspR